jgi:hypothetical protein
MTYYIPASILKENRPQDLEIRITNEYIKHIGKSSVKACLAYLTIARRWIFYGSIYFHVCKTIPNDGDFKQRVENWIMGINESGIYIMDMDKHVIFLLSNFRGS